MTPSRRWRRRQDSELRSGNNAAGGFVRKVLEGPRAGLFVAIAWRPPKSQMRIVGTPYHRTETAAKRAVERWLTRQVREEPKRPKGGP